MDELEKLRRELRYYKQVMEACVEGLDEARKLHSLAFGPPLRRDCETELLLVLNEVWMKLQDDYDTWGEFMEEDPTGLTAKKEEEG